MKKRLYLMLITVISVFSLAGCTNPIMSKTRINYWNVKHGKVFNDRAGTDFTELQPWVDRLIRNTALMVWSGKNFLSWSFIWGIMRSNRTCY